MVGNIWDQYVESNARRFGVPPALVQGVIGAESGGRANAVSRAGAGGYMQLMPNTYAELAQKHGFGEDRFDPANNIGAGTSYLRQLYDKFGNWPDAIAAYNAGPSRVDRVKAGTSTMPAETQAYVPGVLKRAGMQGTDMARQQFVGAYDDDTELRQRLAEQERLGFPAARRAPGTFADATTPETEAQFGKLLGLLQVAPEKNWMDGLGGLLGKGQTPSQPPGPSVAQPTGVGSPVANASGVSTRMDELMQQLLQPQTRGPSLTPGQYQLAGAGEAVGKLAGVHNRKVGIGEILGALGGGLTRGTAAAEQAQQERLGSEFDRLGKFSTLQNQQRTADLNERNSAYDNQYKQALTQKALAPEGMEPKVVGDGVYVNGKWEPAPWAKTGGGGPFQGTAIDAQMYNQLVTLEQKQASGQPLSQQETYTLALIKRHLTASKQTVNGAGQVVEETPAPLPQWGGQQATQGPAPTQAAPPPNANGTQATQTTVLPSGAKVTTVGDRTPTNEQTLNASFANRLNGSTVVLDQLEAKNWKGPGFLERNVGDVPLIGNYAKSAEFQQHEQAQREFINAQLRRESGAAVSDAEFENARLQYFPQPGDSDAVLAQKRRARSMAVSNMAQMAGPAKLGFTPPKVAEPGGEDPLGIR